MKNTIKGEMNEAYYVKCEEQHATLNSLKNIQSINCALYN